MDRWAYDCGVEMDFSRPGKPTDNAFIEAFHGIFRRECLSQHWFMSLDDVRQTLSLWKDDYNQTRQDLNRSFDIYKSASIQRNEL